MTSEYLSDIDLYYSNAIASDSIVISGDEYYHLIKVMRHLVNDEIMVTDGKGAIYRAKITNINKDNLQSEIIQKFSYTDEHSRFCLCLPYLKNTDRLEFALEKCTELGITQFIIYTSERTIQRAPKLTRWNKIVLSAMKQSLRSFMPEILIYSLPEINNLDGKKILFDQGAEVLFSVDVIETDENHYLIIGPEGGLSDNEINIFSSAQKFKLAPNRLRSETAAVVTASLII